MRIGVVALTGTFDAMLMSVLDVLRVAERLRPTVADGAEALEVVVAGIGARARTAGGATLAVEHRLDRSGAGGLDLVVVPALAALDAPELETALGAADVRALREVLADPDARGEARFAAACTGTFILGEAGLLDGRRATTTWWLTALFARRYPRVALDMSRMVVDDGRVTTAGAAFAHIDLAMTIVSRASPALAAVVAERLLVDERPARSAEAALDHLATTDVLVNELEDWIRAHLDEPIDIATAARALHTTRRTLERHVRTRLGVSPGVLVRRIRLEQARHLRRTTPLSLGEIAPRVGYGSAETLRRALARSAIR